MSSAPPFPLRDIMPQCRRCGEIIGVGADSSVWVRYQDECHVGGEFGYHAECAPLFNGLLMKPGRVYVIPYPKVQNRKATFGDGSGMWRMKRIVEGRMLAFQVVLTPEMLRFDRQYCAVLLLRARRKLRIDVAEAST